MLNLEMMIDIFSSFDPAINLIFSSSSVFFWVLNFFIVILFYPVFWLGPNRIFWFVSLPLNIIYEQCVRTFRVHLKGFPSILVSLFVLLIFTNFSGILPYVFSLSSHLLFTLVLGLPLWLGLILSGVFYSFRRVAASLLPSGAPSWLNPFLILIETVRICVRPITLSFRLAANISAGHIVLTLIRVYLVFRIFMLGRGVTIFLLFVEVGYTLFEFGICIIQAYIFCLLLSLYTEDHPSHI